MKLIPTLPSRPPGRRTHPRPRRTSTPGAPVGLATRRTLAAVGAVCLAFATTITTSASPATPAEVAPAPTPEQRSDPILMRGRYLVENVGLCADCHSPRDEKGQFLRDRWMLGSALPFQPMVPMPWAPVAPPLAGLPSMTEAQALTFLQTGQRPDGLPVRPPMPPFRFGAEDAKAVVTYLKALKADGGAIVPAGTHATLAK